MNRTTAESTLVVGAGSGIGREITQKLLREGESVIAADIATEYWDSQAKQLAGLISCDVLSSKSTGELTGTLGRLGIRLKGLVFTVGRAVTRPIQSMKPEAYAELFDLNTMSFFNLLAEIMAAGLFSRDGASVVVISSLVSELGARGKTAYSASKGALNAAVRSLSQELALEGLRVNAISPGTIQTGMLNNLIVTIGNEEVNKLAAEFPLGFGYPTDIADLAYYLLDPASRWITGTVISIDGGYSAR